MKKIALLNFGGIGDEILFSPVIQAVHQAQPEAKLTLFLERRSQAIADLFTEIADWKPLDLSAYSRPKLFWTLLQALRKGRYDAVVASGSSPFIALMLFLSGIPIRVGFDSSKWSRWFLTHPAPLNPAQYAGAMYFSLAEAFLKATGQQTKQTPQPKLTVPQEAWAWAEAAFIEAEGEQRPFRLVIHPGVSQMSVQKNILKAWSPEHWATLIEAILNRHPQTQIYLMGGPDDRAVIAELTQRVQALPEALQQRVALWGEKTQSFLELAACVAQADLLVSVDSAPMHLAVGLDRPVVALFGPTDPEKLLPKGPHWHAVTVKDLPCRPCLWTHRQTSCDAPVCLNIEVAAVLTAIEAQILGRS